MHLFTHNFFVCDITIFYIKKRGIPFSFHLFELEVSVSVPLLLFYSPHPLCMTGKTHQSHVTSQSARAWFNTGELRLSFIFTCISTERLKLWDKSVCFSFQATYSRVVDFSFFIIFCSLLVSFLFYLCLKEIPSTIKAHVPIKTVLIQTYTYLFKL